MRTVTLHVKMDKRTAATSYVWHAHIISYVLNSRATRGVKSVHCIPDLFSLDVAVTRSPCDTIKLSARGACFAFWILLAWVCIPPDVLCGLLFLVPSPKSLYSIATLSHHTTHFAVLLVMLLFAVATARVLFRFLFVPVCPHCVDLWSPYYEHPRSPASES